MCFPPVEFAADVEEGEDRAHLGGGEVVFGAAVEFRASVAEGVCDGFGGDVFPLGFGFHRRSFRQIRKSARTGHTLGWPVQR